MRRPRRRRRKRPAVGRVMPGQLHAAAEEAALAAGVSRLSGHGDCALPRLPSSPASLFLLANYVCIRTPPARTPNTSCGRAVIWGEEYKGIGGSSPCLRVIYSQWSGWKQTFPTCCTELRSCTQALCRERAVAPRNTYIHTYRLRCSHCTWLLFCAES